MQQYNALTMSDGTVINKAGLMTGGSSRDDKQRAERWDKAEHDNLKRRGAELEKRLDALQQKIDTIGHTVLFELKRCRYLPLVWTCVCMCV